MTHPITHLTPSPPRTGEGREYRPLNPHAEMYDEDDPENIYDAVSTNRHRHFEKEYGHLLFHCTNPPDNDEPIEVGRCEIRGWQRCLAFTEDMQPEPGGWVDCTKHEAEMDERRGWPVRQSFRIKDEAEQKVTVDKLMDFFKNIVSREDDVNATDKAPVSAVGKSDYLDGVRDERQRIIGVIEGRIKWLELEYTNPEYDFANDFDYLSNISSRTNELTTLLNELRNGK